MKNNDVKSMCRMFTSGHELSNFLLLNKIHLFFVEGVDGVGKTSLLNDMKVTFTHFPSKECSQLENPSPFDYALDIVSTVYGKVKEAACRESVEQFPESGVNLFFDRGFMSTLAYAPTIIREYVSSYEPSYYYRDNAWELGADEMFSHALQLMMNEYVKDSDRTWFIPVWRQFIEGLLQCSYVHIVYLPSYDSHGLLERLKKRGLSEDMKLINSIGENGVQQQLEERLEAYDFIRLLFSTLPMVLSRHDTHMNDESVKLFLTSDEFRNLIV